MIAADLISIDALTRLGRILLILALAMLALSLIKHGIPKLREVIATRQGNREYSQRVRTLARVVRYALTVLVLLVTAITLLDLIGISVVPILGAAGVVGIALGFGAQSLVKDFFTGMFLLLENQIRLGDVVEAGGKAGVVEEMTLRYLRLRDYSGTVHFIPNGEITHVSNMSLGYAYAVVDVAIAYHEDIDRVAALMRATGAEMRGDAGFAERILDDFEIAGVEQWADSALIIRCRFKVAPLEQWAVRREYLKRLKGAFDMHGIEIPYPHRSLILERANGPRKAAAHAR